MNNSIIVLLGLLVVLLPFGTSMNAIGIAGSEYYTDQYMRYADDMVNEYEDEPSYANDDDGYGSEQDRPYGNNNYDESKYPSYKSKYKPDYNEEFKSYGYDDKYKSKDNERNSVSISKINCNAVNYNFNNVAIGNFSNGNSGIGGASSSSRDGTNGDLSANANGNNVGGYHDGYQKDKDITCISNINNNNTNIATGAAGNATNGDGNETLACIECFDELGNTLQQLLDNLDGGLNVNFPLTISPPIPPQEFFSLDEICEFLLEFATEDNLDEILQQIIDTGAADTTPGHFQALLSCIEDFLGFEDGPTV